MIFIDDVIRTFQHLKEQKRAHAVSNTVEARVLRLVRLGAAAV